MSSRDAFCLSTVRRRRNLQRSLPSGGNLVDRLAVSTLRLLPLPKLTARLSQREMSATFKTAVSRSSIPGGSDRASAPLHRQAGLEPALHAAAEMGVDGKARGARQLQRLEGPHAGAAGKHHALALVGRDVVGIE